MIFKISGQEEEKEDVVAFSLELDGAGDVRVIATHSKGGRDFVGYFRNVGDGTFTPVDGVRKKEAS